MTQWPLLLLAVAVLAAAMLLLVLRGRRERSTRAKLAAGWGRLREKHRDMERIGLYSRLTRREGRGVVDNRTWRDLELDAVFAHVDRTSTAVGQQLLCARLRAPPRDRAEREAFEVLVQRFGTDEALRERTQVALAPLADLSASMLPGLFFGEQVALPRPWLPPLLTVATIVCLGLLAAHPAFLLVLFGCFGLNLAMRFHLWSRMRLLVEPARELDALLAAGRRLAALDLAGLRALTDGLDSTLSRLGRLSPVVSWLAADRSAGNEISGMVLEYLNVFLLFDVNAFALTMSFLGRHSHQVRELYEAIGRIDVALSVASLRAGGATFAQPEIDDGPLALEELVHPLVNGAMPNSLCLNERGLFITGSNMSGKSTFLKAVGVNVILAQALGTPFAKRYQAPFLTVRTLIVGGDVLAEGKSYYLAEVLAARERLEAIGAEGRHLVLVDELFRGTNTDERIGASKAYLEALVRGGALTVAASHDQELGGLLAETFSPKHFTERVEGQEVVFDYRFRDGACAARNAIRILELAGFSAVIVEEAHRVAQGLSAERGTRGS